MLDHIKALLDKALHAHTTADRRAIHDKIVEHLEQSAAPVADGAEKATVTEAASLAHVEPAIEAHANVPQPFSLGWFSAFGFGGQSAESDNAAAMRALSDSASVPDATGSDGVEHGA